MKYDLMITCMFSLSQEKYIKALENFLKYGLLNINNRKIILNILIAEKDYDNFIKYHIPYNFKIFTFKDDNVSEKIYNFYKNNSDYISESTRWHIQVDDDSSTDIDGLITKLDEIYDPSIPIHMISGALNDLNNTVKSLLNKYNFPIEESNGLFKFTPNHWKHEWEFSVQSNSFFKRIKDSTSFHDILDTLSKAKMFSDHGLSLLALLNKIPIVTCRFAHYANILENFSLNGGRYYHIHYLKDINYKNILNLNFILENIVEKHMIFYGFNEHSGYTLYCSNFKLNKDNTVDSCNENEKFWSVHEDLLYIRDINKHVTSFFQTNLKIFNEQKMLVGQFNLYSNKNSAYIKIL